MAVDRLANEAYRDAQKEMLMHPAMIVTFAVALRCVSVGYAGFRILGLGLGGTSDTSWQFWPAFVLLYFALAPKPLGSAWGYVAVSGLFLLLGYSPLVSDLYLHPNDAPMHRYMELALLALSMLLHIAYASWKVRGDEWRGWQRL